MADQPLGIHCDHAAEVTAYLLHLSGYQVREISVIDPAVNSGHVVMEVFLPEQARWVMLDPDYGVVVSDHEGMLMSTAEIVACANRERDSICCCLDCEKDGRTKRNAADTTALNFM